jgi:hypothetical protein
MIDRAADVGVPHVPPPSVAKLDLRPQLVTCRLEQPHD